jgi:glycosyltransferase involved in cell wall biosynthesis
VAAAPVSVVIPAYQARRTIAAAVLSAQAQRPAPREVVVVDDGSHDGTGDVVAALPGVRLIRQDNRGPAAARNRGLAACSQEWIGFLDADDRWKPGKLARQLDLLRRCPELAVVACAGTGAALPRTHRGRRLEPGVRVAGHGELLFGCLFPTTSVLGRRALLTDLGGFDSTVDGAEDWDLWLRCARRTPIAVLEEPLVDYRDRAGSYSKNLPLVYAATLRVLARELSLAAVPAGERARVRARHDVHFALALLAAGNMPAARAIWRMSRETVPTLPLLRTVAGYGVPYAVGRGMGRLRARLASGVAATSS